MNNQPLSSSDQFKILIFLLLLIPPVVFYGIGLIPAIFIGFGLFMMNKNKDFSYVVSAEKNFKIFFKIIMAIIVAILSLSFIIAVITNEFSSNADDFELVLGYLFSAGVCLAYIILSNVLFFDVLKAHSEWVEINGIFSNRAKQKNSTTKADIIENENLGKNSVADELT